MSSIRRIIQTDWFLDSFFLGCCLFIFYTAWLGSYPLFTPDEARYTEVAREMLATGDFITPHVNGIVFLDKPIFYYWLQAAAIALFGIKEWSIRLFPTLFGIFGCLVTYACGRRLFGRLTGILSAIMLATTPLYFAAAHYANLDLEVAVLISCSLLFFITGIKSLGRTRLFFLLSAYAFSGLAVLTKGLIGLAFPIGIIGLWMLCLNKWQQLTRIHLLLGMLLFMVIVLPWYLLVQQANPNFFHYFFLTQHVTRFLSGAEFNNQTAFWFYIPVVLIGLFPWSMFLLQACFASAKNLRQPQNDVVIFLWIWVAVVFTFFSIPHSKIISYILPIFPPLVLLLAHYFAQMLTADTTKKLSDTAIALALSCSFFALLLFWLPQQPWLHVPQTFTHHAYLIAITFIAFATLCLLLRKHNNWLSFFAVCAACSGIYLLTFISGASHLNTNTAKPLITYLQTIIKPDDEVINYHKYFYDVPLYLGQRITIVSEWDPEKVMRKDNWARELLQGKLWQAATAAWLIEEDTFWERWNSRKRLFVFMNANHLDEFKSHATSYFYLGKYNDIILLSNQPTIINETYLKTHNLFDINVRIGNVVKTNNNAKG